MFSVPQIQPTDFTSDLPAFGDLQPQRDLAMELEKPKRKMRFKNWMRNKPQCGLCIPSQQQEIESWIPDVGVLSLPDQVGY